MKKNYSFRKRLGLSFTVLLFSFGGAYSQTKVIEDFNTYAIGEEAVDLNGLGTATNGWGSAWEQTHGQILLQRGNLIAGPVAGGQHAKSTNGSTNVNYYRYLKDNYENKAGATYWLGFQLDPTVEARWGGLGLFHYATEIMLIGTPNGFNELGVAAPGLSSKILEGTSASEKARFVVRIDMKGEEGGNPVVYVWKDPDMTVQPSIETAGITMEIPRLANGFNRVRLGHRDGASLAYDHIRISTDWHDLNQLEEPEPGPVHEPEYLASENFDSYELAEGEGTDLKGLGSATNGWAGPWEMVNGSFLLKKGNIPADEAEGGIHAVTESVNGSAVNYYRSLSGTWENMADKQYWLGFQFNPLTAPNWGGLFLYLYHKELAVLGIPNATGQLGLAKSGTHVVMEKTSATDSNWFVARIDMTGPDGVPQMYVWNNPDPNTEPNPDNAVLSVAMPELANGFNRIRIGNHASGSIAYDHIRLSNRWQDLPFQTGLVTSIPDAAKADYLVYPVPANGNITVEHAANTTITFTTMDGRILKSVENKSNKANVDISDLKPGVYILSVDKGTSRSYKRIVVGSGH
ncbi:T9SS type A sorting domain-containing protein [Pontibacter sp. 13R65]|uniref:T9SS type A sorting domain-containing protein n=1 Tax=Pontibacter sp. 13R65 TaxID=3127458 RepID=UPI00301DDC09